MAVLFHWGNTMKDYAKTMMVLFSGMEEAHGEFIILDDDQQDGEKTKGRACTLREPITIELWENHLNGKKTLGVIPIKSDNTCVWGAIDIDDYTLDIVTLARRVHKMALPLIPFRSKSGGCHLVLFLSEPVPAKLLQAKLSEIAAVLGFGRSEIFPKQTKVLIEKGDLGNWLNMPYFGLMRGMRYALDSEGKALQFEQFAEVAYRQRVTKKEMEAIKSIDTKAHIPDGPPCLQALVAQGFPQGTRNNGLFALGVYCKQAFPDDWQNQLEKMNQDYMTPPLPLKEVQTVCKQVDKKDYGYKCTDQPLASFCNAITCRTRQFGVGGGALPVMTGLSKIPTDQPVWFMDVNGIRLEFTTEELQMQTKFQKVCMDVLTSMPPKVSERVWQARIQEMMNDCKILEKPKEAGITDQFTDLLFSFVMDSRLRASSKEELLLGRPWVGDHPDHGKFRKKGDPEFQSGDRVYFRLKDLAEYLSRKNFKYFNRSQIISRLTSSEIAAESYFFNIKGRGVNVWHIKEPEETGSIFDLPDMGGAVL